MIPTPPSPNGFTFSASAGEKVAAAMEAGGGAAAGAAGGAAAAAGEGVMAAPAAGEGVMAQVPDPGQGREPEAARAAKPPVRTGWPRTRRL